MAQSILNIYPLKKQMIHSEISAIYGNKLRVRACGLLIEDGKVLLVKHNGLGELGYLWSPVGGGVEIGESAEAALVREFAEETGLTIRVDQFLLVFQFIKPPLHAIELFFAVSRLHGELRQGTDPETEIQIIEKVQFLTFDELNTLPSAAKHGIFQWANSAEQLLALRGLYAPPK